MSTRRVIYPGSFDPITNGHIDLAERALRLFDELIIAIAHNPGKSPLFTKDERIELTHDALKPLKGANRIKVMAFDGLLVNFAMKQKATAIIRGLRAVSDFEYELQLALTNRKLEPKIETIFMMPKENFVYLSSNLIKEIAKLKGNIKCFVPPNVESALKEKYQ